ncbi:MAG: hypothetical protein PHC68_00450 [Syntrophorhabdaceae bacterium]|nr:hypothetical protein [Syntrophorhabdaceae bacterium]
MQNIPIEGEYCGNCLFLTLKLKCLLYRVRLDLDIGDQGEIYRLPQCLSDKPQILTEKERQAIYDKGYENGKTYQENRSRML